MERHAIKTNRLTTGKTVLQSVTKTGKPIFAYLRMSTKKKNQEDSIENQNNKVLAQVRSLGINIEDIQRFEDAGISWYKRVKTKDGKILSRPREWLTQLLNAIDILKEPCLLFTYDPSRLARNSSDAGVIIERLWHNWNKQKIERIYFSMGDGDMWDGKTPRTDMLSSFISAERESEKKGKYMKDNILWHLQNKIFPPMIPTPPWLKATKQGLEVTDKMQYVQRAMQMRIDGKSLKTIHTYISSQWIKTSLTSITNSIFLNPLYIGTYQDWQGEIIEDLRFVSWKPPISNVFFAELRKHIGKKTGWYWEKQEKDDIIAKLLTWKQDIDKIKSFSLDTKKDKNKNYKSNAYWGFSRSEIKILKDFIYQAIPKIVTIYFNFYNIKRDQLENEMNLELKWLSSSKRTVDRADIQIKELEEELKVLEAENSRIALIMALYLDWLDLDDLNKMNLQELLDELDFQSDLFKKTTELKRVDRQKRHFMRQFSSKFIELETIHNKVFYDYWKKYGELYNLNTIEFLGEIKEFDMSRIRAKNYSKDRLISVINESRNLDIDIQNDSKEERLKQLNNKLIKVEEETKRERINLTKLLAKEVITKEAYNETLEDMDKEKKDIESQIEKLWESTDIEQFLERLPEILTKTFELASKALSSADIDAINSELRQLIEIVTFELEIGNKKELLVKLQPGLNNLVFLDGAPDMGNLRTFVENYDRVARKYNFSTDWNSVLKNRW